MNESGFLQAGEKAASKFMQSLITCACDKACRVYSVAPSYFDASIAVRCVGESTIHQRPLFGAEPLSPL